MKIWLLTFWVIPSGLEVVGVASEIAYLVILRQRSATILKIDAVKDQKTTCTHGNKPEY
jgi:hypothetical protein